MERWYIALIAVSAMVIAGLTVAEADSSEADSPAQYTFVFNFTVLDENGAGIQDVTVQLSDGYKLLNYRATTDENGEATVTYQSNNTEGIFAVFEKSGYTVSSVEDLTTMTRWTVIDGEFVDTSSTSADGDLIDLPNITPAKESTETEYDVDVGSVTMTATTFTTTLHDGNGKGLESVEISVVDYFGNVSSYKTGDDGSFTINLSSNYGTKLFINMTGYTANEIRPYMTIKTDSDLGSYVNLDISGKYEDGGISWSTLNNSSKSDAIISYYYPDGILMVKTEGILSINVQMSDGTPIVGAEVTVVNKDTDESVIKSTDSDGNVVFTVSTGSYYFKVSVGGFKDYDSRDDGGDSINVSVNQTTSFTSTLEEKTSTTYFGLNTGHILMITGIAIGIILALLSYLLYTRRLHSELEENGN